MFLHANFKLRLLLYASMSRKFLPQHGNHTDMYTIPKMITPYDNNFESWVPHRMAVKKAARFVIVTL